MHLLALSLNHTTAPLPLREKVAFTAERVCQALPDLRRRLSGLVPESAILSTCNRTELYCAVREPHAAQGALVDWLAQGSELPRERLRAHMYALPHQNAVRHAFRLASGLDSMVLGEPQILGQMKQAARHAEEAGALGTHLHQLFQRSFAVAKEVRTRTDIGAAAVSMAAAAVRLSQRVFPDLGQARVLFIGAGEMIELAATHFTAQRPCAIAIANRTLERAERLASRFGARAMRLAQLPAELERFDVVVSSTASTLPIVGLGMVERASRARAGRPLVMLDLAVPRDVEPEAARLPNVFLHTVDDLAELVKSGLSSRQAAVAQAEAIIDSGVASFMQWLNRRRVVPLVQAINAHAELVRRAELQRARRRLERGEPIDRVLASLSNTLSNKLLHGPRAVLGRGTLAPEDAQRLADQCIGLRRIRI